MASMLGLTQHGSSLHRALPASIASRQASGDFTGPHPSVTAQLPAVQPSIWDRIPWTSVAVTAASAVILVSALMIWSSARQQEAPAIAEPVAPQAHPSAIQRARPGPGEQNVAAGRTGLPGSDAHGAVLPQPALEQTAGPRDTASSSARRRQPGRRARHASPSARGMLARGREHLRRGEFNRAREAFSMARRDRRLRGRALVGLAQVEFQTGNLLAAEAYAKVAVNTSHSTAAQLMLGHLCFKRGDYAAAAKQYRAVIARRPDHAEARSNLRLAQSKLQPSGRVDNSSSTGSRDAVSPGKR